MVTTATVLAITVATLAIFTGLGLWYTRGKISSVEDFITARNTTGAGMTAATLIASSMGAWILFSPAEAGAAFGGIAAVLGYGIGSAVPMLAFIWLGPRIRALIPEGHTLTEYVRTRFGAGFHTYVLAISVTYMFVFLAAEMSGIAGALGLVAGVPTWVTALLIGGFVLVYTIYGGLLASLFTDTIQTLLILPLLAVGFAGAIWALGGVGQVHADVLARAPETLDLGFVPGLTFGAFVIIAILGAEMLNQAWWQRIYAAKDEATLRRGFAMAAMAILPMILLAGLFGLAANGLGLVGEAGSASISFFLVLQEAFPAWVTLGVVLLAILLVMSTADTLFNAISSLVTADLPTLVAGATDQMLTRAARAVTLTVAAGAIFVGAQGYSVLQLFLIADLLAAATFLPMLHGLWSERANQAGALTGSLVGLVGGLVFFPTLRGAVSQVPWLGARLPEPSFLYAFLVAAVGSAVVAWLGARMARSRYDLGRLSREIGRLDETGAPKPHAPPEADTAPGGDGA